LEQNWSSPKSDTCPRNWPNVRINGVRNDEINHDVHVERREKKIVIHHATFSAATLLDGAPRQRKNRKFIFVLLLIILGALQTRFSLAQTSVTTWHYNNSRNAVNNTETVLAPANVNPRGFGKLYTQTLDGLVVGHPLYMPALNIPGSGIRNVVFVATMEDSVYAFDVENPGFPPLWVTSLLTYSPVGAVPVSDKFKGCQVTTDWADVGVVSTPVIESSTACTRSISRPESRS